MAKSSGGSYRSAISGKYVTAAHGKRSPSTTVLEAPGKSGSTGGATRSAVSGQFVKAGSRSPSNTTREK